MGQIIELDILELTEDDKMKELRYNMTYFAKKYNIQMPSVVLSANPIAGICSYSKGNFNEIAISPEFYKKMLALSRLTLEMIFVHHILHLVYHHGDVTLIKKKNINMLCEAEIKIDTILRKRFEIDHNDFCHFLFLEYCYYSPEYISTEEKMKIIYKRLRVFNLINDFTVLELQLNIQ